MKADAIISTRKAIKAALVVMSLFIMMLSASLSQAQSGLANPLLRPSDLGAPGSGDGSMGEGESPEGTEGSEGEGVNSQSIRSQAANRLSQEQLSIEQQRLNSSLVPKPLTDILFGMNVVAHFGRVVVLRGVATGAQTATNTTTTTTGTGDASAATLVTTTALPVLSSNVLRFILNQPTQLAGYTVRATRSGSVIMVDWLDTDRGSWSNVYMGTLQSGVGVISQPVVLEKPDTEAFEYLQPELDGNTGGGNSSSNTSTTN